MKLRALVLLNALVAWSLTTHGQLLMKAGDSYVFQFKRLDLYGVDFTFSAGMASTSRKLYRLRVEDAPVIAPLR